MRLTRFFSITTTATPGASALSYVPLVVFSRGLSFIRMLLVAKILGDAGQREFGIYQPALELINWLVPLVMFGLGDVAERYAGRFEREGRLASWSRRQFLRLAGIGAALLLVMIAASPWIAEAVFKISKLNRPPSYGMMLVGACGATIVLLALYQYLAAILRGLGAYAPAAAMETLSAILFLGLSALAAWKGGALGLIYMYGVSLLIPIVYFGTMLVTHLQQIPVAAAEVPGTPRLNRFAAWALVRLLLVMTFGFLSVWGVGHLAMADPQAQTAAYTMPYRIAQLMAYVAVTLWGFDLRAFGAIVVGISGPTRAKVQLFRVGKFGAVLLTLLAVALLLGRGIFAALMPAVYAAPIHLLLPPLLAVFIWYGLLAFASSYADLQETPHRGAWLWGAAVATQLALILVPSPSALDASQQVLFASAFGLGVAVLFLSPIVLWHPFKLTATAVPLALTALAPLALFSPSWIVDYIAPPALLAAVAFIYLSGLLIRPIDRRGWRKFRAFFSHR